MLLCYLDDSGKDPQNPITTLAGYIATEDAWRAFEVDVEPWFTEFGVGVLHSKQLHDTDGDFSGWSVLRKQAFVARVCQARTPHLMMGMSMSAAKGQYQVRAEESDRKRTVTSYSFCFNVIIDWVLRDYRLGARSNTEGVAFILECGHENNPEAQEEFANIRKLHRLEHVLHSISFISKKSCRAIQLADLLAFYSRRDSAAHYRAREKGQESYPIETMIKIITENLAHRGFVATDFGPDAKGRPF